MTIQNLVDEIKSIVLNDMDIRSYSLGNTWDQSVTKGDQYPHFWFEMPVLVSYNVQAKQFKTFTFSINILQLPKMDNPADEIHHISECEVLMDEFLLRLNQSSFDIVVNPTSLSIKSVNADNACGVRADIQVNTKRECLR